jgi:hypothetical protein
MVDGDEEHGIPDRLRARGLRLFDARSLAPFCEPEHFSVLGVRP